jgi:hypothetical protein
LGSRKEYYRIREIRKREINFGINKKGRRKKGVNQGIM